MGACGHLLLEIENGQGEELEVFKVHLKFLKGRVGPGSRLCRALDRRSPDDGLATRQHLPFFLRRA